MTSGVGDIEALAQRIVKSIIKKGFKPYQPFPWSLEIAQDHHGIMGALDYEKLMEFLLGEEWLYKQVDGDFFITDWGASQAFEID